METLRMYDELILYLIQYDVLDTNCTQQERKDERIRFC